MKKKNTGVIGSLDGLLSAMGKTYKQIPQVKGRIARALAKETKGGKGKISSRPSYKKGMKVGYKQRTPSARAKIDYALARNTKGGKGKINKRSAYKKHMGK